MPENPQKKFYLTTPIYYVNARPHIGHAYTTIVADVLARRHRLLGEDVFFLTGTDEHGQKIERSAAAAGIPPQQFADQVSASFEALWKRMGITNNDYIRTTEPRHAQGAQLLFKTLYERGHIELRSYTGTYCVSDEAFVDVPAGTPCPECGRITETITEENFFFKLSAFQQQLIDLIESNELAIEPAVRKNEVLSFLRGGLKNLSISRSSFTWGIPVPEPAASTAAQKHIIYVWLDALTNYMTAVGYGSEDPKGVAQFEKYWPADLHLVGKEIIRFHCVYWPAFLLAAALPLPKKVQAHGWLLFEESKMSKSRGNIVRTETILEGFGNEVYAKQFPESTQQERDLFASDVLRYFLLREIPFGNDGSFSFDALITRYNADLANGYGNLVSRTLSMIDTNFAGVIPISPSEPIFREPIANANGGFVQATTDTITMVSGHVPAYIEFIERNDFSLAVSAPMASIAATDRYISDQAPWKLAKGKDESSRLELSEILYTAAESIRIITALLHPFMPVTTAKVWAQLGLGDIEVAAKNGELKDLKWGGLKPGTKLGPLAPIFPRADKGLAQIMTDMENPIPQKTEQPAPTPEQPPTPGAATPAATNQGEASTEAAKPESPTITIDDFAKIDLRAAVIMVAERIPKADKLLRLEVDLGNGEKRQILSGIAEHYTPEDLIGRRIVIIANLAPRKMRGLESHGMLLAASEGENGKPILATFGEEIAPGSRLK